MKVLGVITARSGSRRLKDKNILPLGTRPLIAWTIEAALAAKSLERVIVSTDSPKYAEIARGLGADVPFIRPAEISTDCDSVAEYSPLIIRGVDGQVDVTTFGGLWKTASQLPMRELNGREIIDLESIGLDIFLGRRHGKNEPWTKIKAISRHRYKGELVRLVCHDALIDVTPNHSIISDKGFSVDTSKIGVGEVLAVPRLPIYGARDSFVGTEELAWLLGFFIAEGSTYKCEFDHGTNYVWQVSNTRNALLQKAARIFRDNFHVSTWIEECDDGCDRLGGSSKKAHIYFLRCYTADGYKKVPKEILNSCRKVKIAFLDGYNAGDGATTPQKKWHSGRYKRFGSVSQPLCAGLIWLIAQTTRQPWSLQTRDDKPQFITIVLNEGLRARKGDPRRVKKVMRLPYDGWVYDLETEEHQFSSGVGTIRAHNTGLVVKHALQTIEDQWWMTDGRRPMSQYDAVCLLQPTSPFRKARHIDYAVDLWLVGDPAATVLSVKRVKEHPAWMFRIAEPGKAEPRTGALESALGFPSRILSGLLAQELPEYVLPNGAIYVVPRATVLAGRIYGDRLVGFLMGDEESLDIEVEDDLRLAEAMLKREI